MQASETAPSTSPRWAQILSDIFSPLLIPTYGMALAMWITPLRTVPEGARLLATLIVAVITGLVPLLVIALLKHFKMVDDNAISRRSQRPVPMLVAVVCYAAAGFIVGMLGAPLWLRMFFGGAALATLLAMFITLRWKISAHTTALGGLTGMMLRMAVMGIADVNVMILLTVGLLLTGLIATTRLLLGRHTLAQTVCGALLGGTCCYIAMCL
ncbi:MAG: hypothetical protein K2M19_02395 [Muribaculaceae bacterium]|nr:hypothetical protein [Muribaculaceae bacterium]